MAGCIKCTCTRRLKHYRSIDHLTLQAPSDVKLHPKLSQSAIIPSSPPIYHSLYYSCSTRLSILSHIRRYQFLLFSHAVDAALSSRSLRNSLTTPISVISGHQAHRELWAIFLSPCQLRYFPIYGFGDERKFSRISFPGSTRKE